MSRSSLVLLLASATSAHAAVVVPPPQQPGLKAVADRLHSTVIAIQTHLNVQLPDGGALDGPCYGTGVLVGDGLAVTTLHSVGTLRRGTFEGARDVQALIPERGPVTAEIVAWFPDLDLAILRLEGAESLQAPPLASEAPAKGEALVAMGIDEEAVTVVGVTVATADDDQLILTSSRRIDSRFWGGPLFDTGGRLVGISLPSLTQPKALSSMAFHGLLEQVRQHEKTAATPTP